MLSAYIWLPSAFWLRLSMSECALETCFSTTPSPSYPHISSTHAEKILCCYQANSTPTTHSGEPWVIEWYRMCVWPLLYFSMHVPRFDPCVLINLWLHWEALEKDLMTPYYALKCNNRYVCLRVQTLLIQLCVAVVLYQIWWNVYQKVIMDF